MPTNGVIAHIIPTKTPLAVISGGCGLRFKGTTNFKFNKRIIRPKKDFLDILPFKTIIGQNFFVSVNITPSSVRSFVNSIKGNSPGKTAVIKRFNPLMVDFEYCEGFEIIIIIMAKIKIEKI